MNIIVIALAVALQVLLFQISAVPFTRSLLEARTGRPAGEGESYFRKAARFRRALGFLLLIAPSAALLGYPEDPGARKLLLAAASVISSAAFAAAAIRDRRELRSAVERAPGAGLRRASLAPRSLRRWYHPAWEGVPPLLTLATVLLVLGLGRSLPSISGSAWTMIVLQALFAAGAFFFSLHAGASVPDRWSRLAALRAHPEQGLAYGESLASLERRYFLLTKIGVTALLGTAAVHDVLEAAAHGRAPLIRGVEWGLVLLLLAAFAGYLAGVVGLTRKALREAGGHRAPAGTEEGR